MVTQKGIGELSLQNGSPQHTNSTRKNGVADAFPVRLQTSVFPKVQFQTNYLFMDRSNPIFKD